MLLLSGSDAAPGEWPWMAVLLQAGQLRQFCSGTLVSASHVLTAAHCFDDRDTRDVVVRLGDTDLRSITVEGLTSVSTHHQITGQTTTACSGAVELAMAKTALIAAHVQTCIRPGQ